MTTFEFKSNKTWLRVWEAINDTAMHFASYGIRAITVFNEQDAQEVREALEEANIKFKEI